MIIITIITTVTFPLQQLGWADSYNMAQLWLLCASLTTVREAYSNRPCYDDVGWL